MASSPPPPMIPLPTPTHVNLNDNFHHSNNDNENDNDNDDAQSDISVPYSSLTESTTSDFLTPTSSDAQTVAGGEGAGINVQSLNTQVHHVYHQRSDEQLDDSLAQWRSLYADDIQRQIESNRNRDRERAAMSLSAGNLRLHTSQTSDSTTLLPEGGGARLNDSSGQTTRRRRRRRRRREGEENEGDPSSSSSSSSTTSSYLNQNDFPPLTVLSPAPTVTHGHHTRSSTPTPEYESAPSSPKPRSPPSRYTQHAYPLPGQTFILLEASTGRALTLIDGNLRLAHVPDPDLISLQKKGFSGSSSSSVQQLPCIVKGQCNWHWHCVETAGWLGFRNAASGTFLGHDMWQNIIARVQRHQGWEWMAMRPTPLPETTDGKGSGFGWYLMVTHWEKLFKINFFEEERGGAFRATDSSEGTIWEFVKV
ncbi:hypothetical protein B0T20DRAFT_456647 [Sordaria brevicollis]|uniref:Uncharacterized protein n=1 Tax=Sordaria brevicollis TaxID=83679 RepID=A0AAE0U5A3_SORBR|nr:hypothetical protein B0T20DRAFT_456647 [Sordaria brevicollis]